MSRLAVALAAAVLAGCGGDARPARDASLLVIVTPPDGSTTVLQRVDPDTLERRGPALDLGEYHDAWAFSPDRRTLALGTFARTGLRLVDPATLRIVRDIPLPVAGEGVGWIGPDRVAVLLQRGGVVVAEADAGRIARRRPMTYDAPCGGPIAAATAHGAAFVVADRGRVRLVRVAATGRVRVLALRRLRAGSGGRTCGGPVLAADPAGERLVVGAPEGPLAEVDASSLAVRYRPVRGVRSVAWPAPAALAIAGRRGSALVDTGTWKRTPLVRGATGVAALGGGTVLSFGGARAGVRASGLSGAARWTAARDVRIRGAVGGGARVYALDDPPRRTRILDARTGAAVATAPPLGRLGVLPDG